MNLKPSDFYAHHRGGGLATLLNQRFAAYLSWAGWKVGLKPTHLTLLNLVLGLAGSIWVIAYVPMALEGAPWWPTALGAFVLWQLAYCLDCADGQLARATASGSEAGARVDILGDIAMQTSVVAAIVSVSYAYSSLPPWVGAAFAALWMTNLVTSVMAKDNSGQSLVTSQNILVRLVKLVRDYSFILTVIVVALLIWPAGMVWVMYFFGAVNGLFLAASIAASAKAAL